MEFLHHPKKAHPTNIPRRTRVSRDWGIIFVFPFRHQASHKRTCIFLNRKNDPLIHILPHTYTGYCFLISFFLRKIIFLYTSYLTHTLGSASSYPFFTENDPVSRITPRPYTGYSLLIQGHPEKSGEPPLFSGSFREVFFAFPRQIEHQLPTNPNSRKKW